MKTVRGKRDYFRSQPTAVLERKDGGGGDEGDVDEQTKKLLGEVKTLVAQQDDAWKKHADEIKAHGKATEETKKAVDEINAQVTKMASQILDLAQKVSTRPAPNMAQAKSMGERFTDSKEFETLKKAGRGTARMTITRDELDGKTTITVGGLPATTPGVLVPQRVPGIITPQVRQLRIRDLLPQGRTTSNSIDYVKENVFTNAAAPVAEGDVKPEAGLTFSVATAPVRTIAHWIPASRQVLDDFVQLRGYIDNRLMYGLKLVEENQLLAGDGLGQNLLGLIPQATAYDITLNVAGDTKIDTIRHAIAQARRAEFPVDGIVMHPDDWATIELVKSTTGEYIIGDPVGILPFRLWGRPVVETTAIAAGTFLVGAFGMGAQIWDREDAAVEVSTEHADFFTRNLVAIRVEERVGLTVYRPGAFITGAF